MGIEPTKVTYIIQYGLKLYFFTTFAIFNFVGMVAMPEKPRKPKNNPMSESNRHPVAHTFVNRQENFGPLVVVGGHSRKIGKTSVIEGLLQDTAHLAWSALKISANRHSAGTEGAFQLTLETEFGADCDTARYLRAGATRALWLRANASQIQDGVSAAFGYLAEGGNVLVESNRVLDYVSPCLYLILLDFAVDDFKESTRKHFARADAFIVVERPGLTPPWNSLPLELMGERSVFPVTPGRFRSESLSRFVEDAVTRQAAELSPDLPAIR